MRQGTSVIIAMVATFAVSAGAQIADPPLFMAFKTFCIETGADPETIKSSIEAAGGIKHASGSTTWPFPMTTRSWDIEVGSHKMLISTGMGNPPAQNGKNDSFTNCEIASFANEDSSIAAIGAWVGVRADDVSRGKSTMYSYHYAQSGSERSALPPGELEYRKTETDGRLWLLTVLQSDRNASIVLTHFLGASKSP